MILYTIGFTRKSARRFFELLDDNGVRTLLDSIESLWAALRVF